MFLKNMFSKKGGKKTLGKMLFSLPALFICIFIAVSLACLWAIAYYMPTTESFSYYNKSRLMLIQDKVVKNEVVSAVEMLTALNNKVQNGEMTLAKAKKLGADLIRDMRYGDKKDGYFFVDTTEGVNVVLYGDKATEGRNRINDNADGVYYVKELIKAGQKADGDFVNYMYPKKGEGMAKQKRSYALEFKPFGWVVGTGYYLEDLKDLK
jgi:methyl-accepting chemotaxis protein